MRWYIKLLILLVIVSSVSLVSKLLIEFFVDSLLENARRSIPPFLEAFVFG